MDNVQIKAAFLLMSSLTLSLLSTAQVQHRALAAVGVPSGNHLATHVSWSLLLAHPCSLNLSLLALSTPTLHYC